MARVVKKFIPEAPKTTSRLWKGSTNVEGTIRQILCEPESPDTIYNIGIKDEDDMVLYARYDVTGILPYENLSIIMFPGEKSIVIEDASKDEMFRIKIIYQL